MRSTSLSTASQSLVTDLSSETILVDVTSFCGNPFLTGIQRQLEALLKYKGSRHLIGFVLEDGAFFRVLPPQFFELIQDFFRSGEDQLTDARIFFHGRHRGRNHFYMMVRHYIRRFGKLYDPNVILPQVTALLNTDYPLDAKDIDLYLRFLPKYGHKFFFIEHDLLFWTLHRHFVPNVQEHAGHIKHLALMRRAPNVGCVSKTVLNDLVSITRRDPLLPSKLVTPGGDSLGKGRPYPAPRTLKVAIVGTIEPRKCSNVILDVLEGLATSIPLEAIFCGTISGVCPSDMAARFGALTEPFLPIRVLSSPTDAEIREVVRNSTVTIYLSDGEGFGVPPLESLSLGVPVIVSGGDGCVPAIASISERGQVRLNANNHEELLQALHRFTDAKFLEEKRNEAASLDVPTWQAYAESIFEWIEETYEVNKLTALMQTVGLSTNVIASMQNEWAHQPGSAVDTASSANDSFFLKFLHPRSDMVQPDQEKGRDSFLNSSQDFLLTMSELYWLHLVFHQSQRGNFLVGLATALIHRSGSVEERREWRRTWNSSRQKFAALISFYGSEESAAKHPERSPRVKEILNRVGPAMALISDRDLPSDEFVAEAFSAILHRLPDPQAFEERIREIESGGPEERTNLLRNLLVSDETLERWYDHAEAWSFLLASVGISSPYWRFAKLAYERMSKADDSAPDSADPVREFVPPKRQAVQIEHSTRFFAGERVEWLPLMHVGANATNIQGVVKAKTGQPGHMLFGPYLRLPAGKYSARIRIDAGGTNTFLASRERVGTVEAVQGDVFLSQREFAPKDCAASGVELVFTITRELNSTVQVPFEIRVWSTGQTSIAVSSITIQRIAAL